MVSLPGGTTTQFQVMIQKTLSAKAEISLRIKKARIIAEIPALSDKRIDHSKLSFICNKSMTNKK